MIKNSKVPLKQVKEAKNTKKTPKKTAKKTDKTTKKVNKAEEKQAKQKRHINQIRKYNRQIQSGKIVTSRKIKRVYQELVRLLDDKNSEYEYISQKADHAIRFIEEFCRQSKGKYGGKKLKLELWQKAMVAAIFGFRHKITGLRKYTQVLLVVGRKNGKSTLAAAIGLYLLIADGEMGAEVYAAATKKDQAKIIWLEAKKMVQKSPELRKYIKPRVAEMEAAITDSFFRYLGSDSDTQDGLNVHGALLDEIHAWKTKDLYDVIVDGESAREQPLTLITTTAGTVRESIYDILYEQATMIINGYDDENGYVDEHFLPLIYEIDERKEWVDSTCWIKANPGLGTIKNKKILAEKVKKAKTNSLLVKNLLCKEFNVRETTTEAWLPFEYINNEKCFVISELKPKYGIGGVDLSATTDLTAAKMIFKVPDDPNLYVISKYWIPEDLIEQRAREDKIPYDIWRDQGYIEGIPGNKVHPKYITEWFKMLRNDMDIYPYFIGYDAWAAAYWVDDMSGTFGKDCMIPVHQGKKTLSIPMHNLGADFKSGLIVYNNNPIDKWCFSNTSVDIDKNGNIQPAKGKSRLKRIDGTAALLDAYTVLCDRESEYMSMI